MTLYWIMIHFLTISTEKTCLMKALIREIAKNWNKIFWGCGNIFSWSVINRTDCHSFEIGGPNHAIKSEQS